MENDVARMICQALPRDLHPSLHQPAPVVAQVQYEGLRALHLGTDG